MVNPNKAIKAQEYHLRFWNLINNYQLNDLHGTGGSPKFGDITI